MVIPHFQPFKTVFSGLLAHVITFGDHLTYSIMKHCQDALQRMAMLLIYLHVSWIRQDCMRSRVFQMWLGMYCMHHNLSGSPLVYVWWGSLCRCHVRCTLPPLKRCVRFSRTRRKSFWWKLYCACMFVHVHCIPIETCVFNNYSSKAKWILSNNPRDKVSKSQSLNYSWE